MPARLLLALLTASAVLLVASACGGVADGERAPASSIPTATSTSEDRDDDGGYGYG